MKVKSPVPHLLADMRATRERSAEQLKLQFEQRETELLDPNCEPEIRITELVTMFGIADLRFNKLQGSDNTATTVIVLCLLVMSGCGCVGLVLLSDPRSRGTLGWSLIGVATVAMIVATYLAATSKKRVGRRRTIPVLAAAFSSLAASNAEVELAWLRARAAGGKVALAFELDEIVRAMKSCFEAERQT